jgi:hypothetical protein
MRSRPLTNAGLVTMGSATRGETATLIPSRCAAVRRLRSGAWMLRVTGLLDLVERPRRLGEHSLANPSLTNGDTPHTEAARRIEMISSGSPTGRTLARLHI